MKNRVTSFFLLLSFAFQAFGFQANGESKTFVVQKISNNTKENNKSFLNIFLLVEEVNEGIEDDEDADNQHKIIFFNSNFEPSFKNGAFPQFFLNTSLKENNYSPKHRYLLFRNLRI
jgi:hypothetical protein